MNKISQERATAERPKWQRIFLPLISFLMGGGFLWLAWLRYGTIVNAPDANWSPWIQLFALGLVGILCLSAAVLSLLGSASALVVFKTGLSIVPLLLFFNLIILLFQVIQNIMQGNAGFFFDRVFAQPHKILLIAIIVIVLILLESLTERDKTSK